MPDNVIGFEYCRSAIITGLYYYIVLQDRNAMYYKGMGDCFMRIFKEEGIGAFYRSLAPRLLSVVPMIAIQVLLRDNYYFISVVDILYCSLFLSQFAVYEAMKSNYIRNHIKNRRRMLAQKKAVNLPVEVYSSQSE
jgi:hypothetical protein